MNRRGFIFGAGALASAFAISRLPLPETDEQRLIRLAGGSGMIEGQTFRLNRAVTLTHAGEIHFHRCHFRFEGQPPKDGAWVRFGDRTSVTNCLFEFVGPGLSPAPAFSVPGYFAEL